MTRTRRRPITEVDQAVAMEIRLELTRQRLSQSHLARALDVSPQWVSARLTGKQAITVSDVELMARALGVPATQLRGDPPSLAPTYAVVPVKRGTLPALQPAAADQAA